MGRPQAVRGSAVWGFLGQEGWGQLCQGWRGQEGAVLSRGAEEREEGGVVAMGGKAAQLVHPRCSISRHFIDGSLPPSQRRVARRVGSQLTPPLDFSA